ncbi:hypothetical protein ALI144C_51065 [Actinosynnema sp. ALI-1.44]|nr:hypothetical protein ALI144C_51065 [Actinosynnema sp. ALI-1.44]
MPETEAPADPWSALLPGQELVPAYLTSRFAAQYRVIVDVLLAEQDTSLTGLSYDEVAAGVRARLAGQVPADVVDRLLAPEVLHLDARLERLVQWRVLTRWQEPARSGEDFLRRRDRYQLTPRAAGLHVFWSSVDDTEEATGDLTLAPRAIHERLIAFAESIRQAVYTDAATEFQQVGAMHQAMATAARGWQRTLAHALSGGPDREHTWEALGSWFGGADSQARRLRRQLRDLVAPWARNMNLLLDTGGAVTRRAELLALAVAVERAPDDESAWRIWDTAVGAFSARHLLLAQDSADESDLSWTNAPPAPVTARFREQGARAAVGRRTKIPDYSTGKSAARRARLAAQAARSGAEAALRQRSGTHLAEWGEITDAELNLLLEFVGVVRRTRSESAVTGDGRWRITLRRPPQAHDTTSLRADSGSMTSLNWYFGMEPA